MNELDGELDPLIAGAFVGFMSEGNGVTSFVGMEVVGLIGTGVSLGGNVKPSLRSFPLCLLSLVEGKKKLSVLGTTSILRVSSGHQGRSESMDVDLATLSTASFLLLVPRVIPMPRVIATMQRPMTPSLMYNLFTMMKIGTKQSRA